MSDFSASTESVGVRCYTEEDCVRALFRSKWPDGFICSRCGHRRAYLISTRRLPLYECQACRAQTSLIAGTVMEGSRTPLRLWFQAIQLHAQPRGINALQLSRIIGVTYKTAWLICHKLRHAMSCAESGELLAGIVRVADTVIYNRHKRSQDLHQQEQPLIIASSENDQGEILRIKMEHQAKEPLRGRLISTATLPFIRRHVEKGAATRALLAFRIGRDRNAVLLEIGRKVECWLAGIFRGIGPKHLHLYLDHFCYAWNRRHQPIFGELLQRCAVTPPITYPVLTGSILRSFRYADPSASSLRIAS